MNDVRSYQAYLAHIMHGGYAACCADHLTRRGDRSLIIRERQVGVEPRIGV